MADIKPLPIQGLKEFQRDLRQLDKELVKRMREGLKAVGQIVVDEAEGDIPVRSGALRRSLKPSATQTEARVKMGTPKRVPYAGWIEFGGTIVFPNRSKGTVVKKRVRQVGGGQKSKTVVGRQAGGAFLRTKVGAVTAERKFIKEGRYLFPAFFDNRQTRNKVWESLDKLMEKAAEWADLYDGQRG